MNRQTKNTSYGIVIYKLINKVQHYCLVCRRDTFTYSEFIRGKYQLEDVDSINRMFSYMTESEQQKILNNTFETLWNSLWVLDRKKLFSAVFKREFSQSKYKFDTLKKGYYTKVHIDIGKRETKFIKMENIINEILNSNIEKFTEPEWGFPKGKKNKNEDPLDCAKREVHEETNIPIDRLIFHTNDQYEEEFIGDNLVEYNHIYYLAECPIDIDVNYDDTNIHQFTEISNIKWLTYEECIEKIRKYSTEKLLVLTNIHNRLTS
jgi:8-oxo-dGTP pyrophosphatase MutT (NUDIX family)